MVKLIKQMSCVAILAITLISCKLANTTNFVIGACKFELPASKNYKVESTNAKRAIISFKYNSRNEVKKANVELLCINKNLNEALPDDFDKKGSFWEFQGGAEGSSTTEEFTGKNWHGLQSKYFQSNACILTVGSADNSHSFRTELCDEEDAIKYQAAPLDEIIRSLIVE